MSVSVLNGMSRHTKFVILKTSLQKKQTWKKTEGYITRFGKEKKKIYHRKNCLSLITLSNYVTCDQYAGCLWCRTVASLDFYCYSTMCISGDISEVRRKVCSFEPRSKLVNHWFKTSYKPNRTLNSHSYMQYLNCRGRVPPSRVSVPPSRFSVPPSRFRCPPIEIWALDDQMKKT